MLVTSLNVLLFYRLVVSLASVLRSAHAGPRHGGSGQWLLIPRLSLQYCRELLAQHFCIPMSNDEPTPGTSATSTVPHTSSSFNPFAIELPERFDFRHPESWKRWIVRWERYRVISGLQNQNADTQINTFLYAMGSEAEDVLVSLRLDDEEAKDYNKLKSRFEKHFIPRRNVIFERARFNQRSQLEHEAVEEFVTDLHRLAESCDFGSLKDELIRDRLVVGLRDKNLSEKLQLDANLTLEKAVNTARQSETVKGQQPVVRGNGLSSSTTTPALDAVTQHPCQGTNNSRRTRRPTPRHSAGQSVQQRSACRWCGSAQPHERAQCPAQGKQCILCQKLGHFATVCQSRKTNEPGKQSRAKRPGPSRGPTPKTVLEEVFLGTISNKSPTTDPWFITARVQETDIRFKVDTGADVTAIPASALPPKDLSCVTRPTKVLYGPGRSKIDTVGQLKVDITWNGRTTRQDVFVVRHLQHTLLGRPAIQSLNVLPQILAVEESSTSDPIASKYKKLFGPLGHMNTAYDIKLVAGAKPHAVNYPRRVPIPLLPSVQAELKRMEGLGVIHQVDRPTAWCAPMVVAKKKDGKLRICVDYAELNKQVMRERLIMPTVEENLCHISGAKLFSKLDANAGYWQVPLSPPSSELTTFITPFGRYRFLRLPFGISTAPEFFQREMLRILEGLEGTSCHMDDILIYGKDQAEHDQRLEAVLKTLAKAGVTLNPQKCQFRKTRIEFLGHILDAEGISADPAKTEAVRRLPPPRNVAELRSFFGMVNHLMKSLPGLAEKTKPLRDLLSQDAAWLWSPRQQQAFESIKDDLTRTPVLAFYSPERPITLSVDASSYGLGAVLLQEETDGHRRPVAYASRALSEAEQRYAQVEKEALAIVWACDKFRMYVLGLQFHVETDHKPLVPIFSAKRLDELTPRLQRLRLRTLEYDFTITHVPGKQLFTADVLSRNPLTSNWAEDFTLARELKEYEALALDLLPASSDMLTRIRESLPQDATLSLVMEYCSTQWPSVTVLTEECRKYVTVADELAPIDGLLLRGTRLVIPAALRHEVMTHLHTGHQGITRCRARAREAAWWPGISQHLHDFIKRCPICQMHRKPTTEPLLQTPLPERPWQVIGMDIFHENRQNYLVVVDYFSKFFEVSHLRTTTSSDLIAELRPMFARYGMPEVVRSDNGPQFPSSEFRRFLAACGSTHITSSPYYPQSNGQAERSVQTAKSLMARSPDLHQALLAYRTTPGACGYTPAELLMGRQLRSNVPVLPTTLTPSWPHLRKYRRRYKREQAVRAASYNKRHRTKERPELRSNTAVRIFAGAAAHGTVCTEGPTPRSYMVQTSSGVTRRTKQHLQEGAMAQPTTLKPPVPPQKSIGTTRYGRTVKQPDRYGY
ncbi:uncharacterized protein K02A2.6-like [Ornithodoros turicata]|uniref:uncharacterized protein K02A2.6-like n=1 Tax=Ornithodoros turicata TaxID=34597 RepID=UPI00313A4B80